MKAGTYIFAKHPDPHFGLYPTIADRVTAKFVFYTDDEGRKVKVLKSSCRLQNEGK